MRETINRNARSLLLVGSPREEMLARQILYALPEPNGLLDGLSYWFEFDQQPEWIRLKTGGDAEVQGYFQWHDRTGRARIWAYRPPNNAAPAGMELGLVKHSLHFLTAAGSTFAHTFGGGDGYRVPGRIWFRSIEGEQIRIGDFPWTKAFWARFDSPVQTQTSRLCEWDEGAGPGYDGVPWHAPFTGGTTRLLLRYNFALEQFQLIHSPAIGGNTTVTVAQKFTVVSLVDGVWLCFVVSFDGNRTLRLRVMPGDNYPPRLGGEAEGQITALGLQFGLVGECHLSRDLGVFMGVMDLLGYWEQHAFSRQEEEQYWNYGRGRLLPTSKLLWK